MFVKPEMVIEGVLEFKPLDESGVKNWYTYNGWNYHISWLIPEED